MQNVLRFYRIYETFNWLIEREIENEFIGKGKQEENGRLARDLKGEYGRE